MGLVIGRMHGAQAFEPGEDPEHAVELAAGRLGIEMATHRDRRQRVVPAGPDREHVADLVDMHVAAEALAFGPEPVTDAAILLAQRQAPNAALGRAADPGGLHEIAPEP